MVYLIKTLRIALGLALSFVLFTPNRVFASDAVVEVQLEMALLPSVGYDDNDNVQIVLHGMIPNACYSLAMTEVEKDESKKTIRIRQFASYSENGICAQQRDLPPHMLMAIPFTNEVSLGQLSSGQYQIEYLKNSNRIGERNLLIAKAPEPTIDNVPYAAVTNASISDVVTEGAPLLVTLSGVLNSTCVELNDNIEVKKEGDVFVVLPVLRVLPVDFCTQQITPFEKVISLGTASKGKYLIHVRSMNGKSVNRVLTVEKK